MIIATLATASLAQAQTLQEQRACRGDFEKLCPGVKPGGGRVIACLSRQKDALTPDCLKVVAAHSK